MAQYPWRANAGDVSGLSGSALLSALEKYGAFVLPNDESLASYTANAGQFPLVIHSHATGYAYYYNANDNASVDDGITVLVDGDSRRYHISASSDLNLFSVIAEQNAPPASPNIGDSYIVGTAPSGGFAGQEKHVAHWTRRLEWVFGEPRVGMTLFNEALGVDRRYGPGGQWGPVPQKEVIVLAASDLVNAISALNNAAFEVFRFGGEIEGIEAQLLTASSSGDVQIDINIGGSSILSSPLVVEEGNTDSEDSSTGNTYALTTDTLEFSKGDRLTADIDQEGTGAVGLLIAIHVVRKSDT